jgi:Trypsin-like peptidase domain
MTTNSSAIEVFRQSNVLRDFVFPLASLERTTSERNIKKILGSAFLIGNRGFALTAKHVLADSCKGHIAGMFVVPTGNWVGFQVIGYELHPSEDVAIVQLDSLNDDIWQSPFCLANSVAYASGKYRLFGYPDDTTFERAENGHALIRPDMIYNEGYIRRRYTGRVPSLLGSSFLELSEIAGTGSSGAPVFKFSKPLLEVIGIYVGEKTNDRSTSVSYAVREEAFRDWVPQILGTSLLEESRNATVPATPPSINTDV